MMKNVKVLMSILGHRQAMMKTSISIREMKTTTVQLLNPNWALVKYLKFRNMSDDAIGIIAGILTSASLIPHLCKTIKERNANNIRPS